MSEITDDQAAIAAQAWELRILELGRGRELWLVPLKRYESAVAELHAKGWLDRRDGAKDTEWRLTDEGLSALRTDAIRDGVSKN